MRYICVACGKRELQAKTKGSMKLPYCKPCYDARFKDEIDYIAYLRKRVYGDDGALKKYITFVLGGFIGAVIGWGLTYYLTEVLNTWYLLSYSLSMAVPFTFKIIYHKMVTFKENKMNTATVLKYLLVYVLIMLINVFIVYIATSLWHIYYMISIFCVTAILSVLNYALNKLFVFSEKEEKSCAVQ